MSKHIQDKIGSTLVARIEALRMPEADRQRALGALYDAHLFVDGIVWVGAQLERAAERMFLKPVLKG